MLSHPALRLINNGNLNYCSILNSLFRIKASGEEARGKTPVSSVTIRTAYTTYPHVDVHIDMYTYIHIHMCIHIYTLALFLSKYTSIESPYFNLL